MINGTLIGKGRNRLAYYHNGFVIKIPRNSNGVTDNRWESAKYRNYPRHGRKEINGICFARCRLLHNDWLVMELLTTAMHDDLPKWAGYVDCGQVGLTKSGHVVAYDYGLR